MSNRWMIETIAAMVPQGSRVLDLGCGDGALLSHYNNTVAAPAMASKLMTPMSPPA
jgi:cyclopropane fatty-acyl-phospholipid synthase-like methyltransferase